MRASVCRCLLCGLVIAVLLLGISCRRDEVADEEVGRRGAIEVVAELVEIPDKFPAIAMYDYAFVLKYKVFSVKRGVLAEDIIYVGHYNPLKPRWEAADARVKGIGGNVRRFRAGDVHHMALEAGIDEHYMGGVINKYHGRMSGPIYWAVWTNRGRR